MLKQMHGTAIEERQQVSVNRRPTQHHNSSTRCDGGVLAAGELGEGLKLIFVQWLAHCRQQNRPPCLMWDRRARSREEPRLRVLGAV